MREQISQSLRRSIDVRCGKHQQSGKRTFKADRPGIAVDHQDIAPAILLNPPSSVDRNLKTNLYANYLARWADCIYQIGETASWSAPYIENTSAWLELEKLNSFLPQRFYEEDVKIGKRTDQMNKVSGIRRRELVIVHSVQFLDIHSTYSEETFPPKGFSFRTTVAIQAWLISVKHRSEELYATAAMKTRHQLVTKNRPFLEGFGV